MFGVRSQEDRPVGSVQTSAVGHPNLVVQVIAGRRVDVGSDRDLQVFTTRIDKSLIREVKIKAVQCNISVQTITDQALRLWMERYASDQ